jgi:pseudouridine synthase
VTNDGRMTSALLSPERHVEKEYHVEVRDVLRPAFKKSMSARAWILKATKPSAAKVKVLGDKSFSITLTEGKKHQIRRMVVAHKHVVTRLIRTRIGSLSLRPLTDGAARELSEREVEGLLNGKMDGSK